MTKEQAQFIAARVPGATASLTDDGWQVHRPILGIGTASFRHGILLFNTHGWMILNGFVLIEVGGLMDQFNSALADARAAGFPAGKQGEGK